MGSSATRLRKFMAYSLGFDEEDIVPDAVLSEDLGLDGYDFLDLARDVELTFGVRFGAAELRAARTVADFERCLAQLQGSTPRWAP